MKKEYEDLPGWSFDADEISAGVYRVIGIDRAGRRVEATGFEPDELMNECRNFAFKMIALGRSGEDLTQMSESNIHEQIRTLFCNDDAPGVREAFNKFPALKSLINEPIGDFNAPPILNVRSREMLDVLLDAGADINAKSRWWAGGFGLLHSAPPELAAYAIQRGATIDIHAAARLGLFDKLRDLISAGEIKGVRMNFSGHRFADTRSVSNLEADNAT